MDQEDLQALDYQALQEVWSHELRSLNNAMNAEANARHEKLIYRGRVLEVEAEMARRRQEERKED